MFGQLLLEYRIELGALPVEPPPSHPCDSRFDRFLDGAAAGGESSLSDQQIDLADQFHVKSDGYLGLAHGLPPRVIATLV